MQKLIVLLIAMAIVACSSNDTNEQISKINSHYTEQNEINIYSELVAVDGKAFYKKEVTPGQHMLHIRVLRANNTDTNQVFETLHRLQVTLTPGQEYSLVNNLTGNLIEVWLINESSLTISSSQSSISTINERVTHLERGIDDKNKRIKVALKPSSSNQSSRSSYSALKQDLKNSTVKY